MRAALRRTGLVAAPLLALTTLLLLPESYQDLAGRDVPFSQDGRAAAALGVWMAVWWMTEAIPIYATALLPLAVLPIATDLPMGQVASPYAHPLIFLFLGGFVLALAMQRWGLDRRIALTTLRFAGTGPRQVVGGFMVVTAFLSMWVSNTATAVMMLPIALSVIELAGRSGRDPHFALSLLLGIAYAASIGGVGTLIGTPPNLFLASYARSQLGIEIGFAHWMGIALPLVAVFLVATWVLLVYLLHPVRDAALDLDRALAGHARTSLGPMSRGERATLAAFAAAVTAWILRPLLERVLPGLTDAGIAMLAAVALFVVPVGRGMRVMDWETAVKLPWGLLVLFGGGLSLAAALDAGGVGAFLGSRVSALAGLPPVVLILCVVTLVIFLTELTSNTATTATLVPILAGIAPGLGLHPFALIVPAAIAASCAFMLPVATPPNAVVFGSGLVTIPQMCRAGLWLNLVGIALITALAYGVMVPLLGISLAG